MEHLQKILDKHQKISFDLDGTLLDGVNSAFFIDYINSNPHKQYHIITFRNREWANKAWTELRIIGLHIKNITSIQSCPEEVHDAFMLQHRNGKKQEIKNYCTLMNISETDFDSYVSEFLFWKGLRSSTLGCTLLVDDMPDMVLPGCELYGIHFLNAV